MPLLLLCSLLFVAASAAAVEAPHSHPHPTPPPNRSHVILPKDLAKLIPKGKLLAETEWRSYGVQQSRGWEHYAIHRPEPHILLFRRLLGTDPTSGKVLTSCAPRLHVRAHHTSVCTHTRYNSPHPQCNR